jgi:hypothetical protein
MLILLLLGVKTDIRNISILGDIEIYHYMSSDSVDKTTCAQLWNNNILEVTFVL